MKSKVKDLFWIFLITFSIRIIPILFGHFLSPDACLYLNIGKNLIEKRGFVISYNFYHFWKDSFYPALPFIHPLFPFLCGIALAVFKSVKAVSFMNIFFIYLNLLLIFFLFPEISRKTRYFLCTLLSLNYTLFYVSLFPWTESLHLFFLILSFYFLKKFSKKYSYFPLIIGIIMGVATLVRAANIFNILGYLLIFLFFYPYKIRNLFLFLVGVSIILLPYEIICLIKYGIFYPQYLKAAKIYGQAKIYGGYYKETLPVLRSNLHFTLWGFLYIFFSTTLYKLKQFFIILNDYLQGFLWLGIIGTYELFRKRREINESRCLFSILFIGIINLLLYSSSVWWDPTLEFHRYILIPYICFFIVFIFSIEKVFTLNKQSKNLFIFLFFFLLFIKDGFHRLNENYHYFVYREKIKKAITLKKEMLNWLNNHINPTDTIATSEYFYAFPLNGVTISLPEARIITRENMKDFLKIYSPKYIWIGKDKLNLYFSFLEKKNYKKMKLPYPLSSFYVVFVREE